MANKQSNLWKDSGSNEAEVNRDRSLMYISEMTEIHEVAKSVCQIVKYRKGADPTTATGFLFKFYRNQEEILGLMTNDHVIKKHDFESGLVTCKFIFENVGKKALTLSLDLKDSEVVFNSHEDFLDATLLTLPQSLINELNKNHAVWLEPFEDVKVEDKIFIVQHAVGGGKYTGEASVDWAAVKKLSQFYIYHNVNTETGSSGSPVVKRGRGLVGLHSRAYSKDCNRATKITRILAYLLNGEASCNGLRETDDDRWFVRVKKYLLKRELETTPGNDFGEGTSVDSFESVGRIEAKAIPKDMDVSEVGSANDSTVELPREDSVRMSENIEKNSDPEEDMDLDEACVSNPSVKLVYMAEISAVGKSVCQILIYKNGKTYRASGFLFKFNNKDNKKMLGLMTNNHVISQDVYDSNEIKCALIFESLKVGGLKLPLNFRDCTDFITSPKKDMDATYFSLPDALIKSLKASGAVWLTGVGDVKVKDTIYIIQHAVGKDEFDRDKYTGKAAFAAGIVHELSDYFIYHKVDTERGSSGSPVVVNGTLVGLHRARHDKERNKATNFKHILTQLLEGTASCDDETDNSGGIGCDEDMDVSEVESTGRPELSNDEIKRRIRSNFSKISKFDPKGHVLNELWDFLTPGQSRELNENSLDQKRGSDLLFMLHRGAHPSVYVRLLQLLEEMEEYKWIVDLIYENKTETGKKIKPKIYNNYATLAGSLNPTDEMLNMLFDKHILTDAERDSFNEPDYHEEDKGRDCLQLVLLSPNPEACGVLLDCIMNESTLEWMVKLINNETSADVNQKENPGAGVDQKEDLELTNDKIKQRLVDNYAEIVKDFDPTGYVLDYLFQEKILTAEMYKLLYKETPRDDRGRVLIDHLRRLEGHPNSYLTLLRSLPTEGNEERIELLSTDQSGSSAIAITLKKEIKGLSNEEIKTRVRKNFSKFVAGFQANSHVLNGLLTANVITRQKCDEYYKTKERDRGRKLISDLLETSNRNAFVVLYNIINGKGGFKDKVELINNDN